MRADRVLAVCTAILLMSTGCSAAPGAPQASAPSEPEYLFVQEGVSGTYTAGDGDYFDLVLAGVDARTVYFADRPATDAGSMPTDEFVASFNWTPTPPNAALVLRDGDDDSNTIAITIDRPVYDAASGTLQYRAKPLSGVEGTAVASFGDDLDPSLPTEFDEVALFIDDGGVPRCGPAGVDSTATIEAADGIEQPVAAATIGLRLRMRGAANGALISVIQENATGAIELRTQSSRSLIVAPDTCMVTVDGAVPAAELEAGDQLRTEAGPDTLVAAVVSPGTVATVSFRASGGSGPGGWGGFYLNGLEVFAAAGS